MNKNNFLLLLESGFQNKIKMEQAILDDFLPDLNDMLNVSLVLFSITMAIAQPFLHFGTPVACLLSDR